MDDEFTSNLWLNIWRTIVQLFYIAVVLGVFSSITQPSARLITALIGVLYSTMRVGFIASTMHLQDIFSALFIRLDDIQGQIGSDYHRDPSLDHLGKIVKKARLPFYFEWGGLGVISLICVFQIFSSISDMK